VKKLLKQAQDADTPREEIPLVRNLLQRQLPQLEKDLHAPADAPPFVQELLRTTLPQIERDLQKRQENLQAAPAPPKEPKPTSADLASFAALCSYLARINGFASPEAELRQQFTAKGYGGIGKERDFSKAADAVEAGQRKYTDIRVPVLALYSLPHKHDSAVEAAGYEEQAEAFEKGIPSARVIRVRNADHFIFLSNETDVLREMRTFLGNLP